MTALATLTPSLTARSFRAIGTTATVLVEDPAASEAAERLLARASWNRATQLRLPGPHRVA